MLATVGGTDVRDPAGLEDIDDQRRDLPLAEHHRRDAA
jgi:hypothetical protein